MFCEDFDDGQGLKGKKNEVFMRRPMFHKQIMKAIGEKKIISIANAGTIVFEMSRKEFVEGLKKGTYTVWIKVKAKGNANYKASEVFKIKTSIVVK